MNLKHKFQTLNSTQKLALVTIIRESVGNHCDLSSFTDIAIQLIDDIAGFESANDCQIRLLVNQLWKIYQK